MTRPIDHLVIAVRDLDAAGRRYEAMGFTVGARNRHPWGTENRIVQLRGGFLELITIGEGAAIAPASGRNFSFGAFIEKTLARGEGLAMLALRSTDAARDAAHFAAAGMGDFDPFHFRREGVAPDGTRFEVAFTLAFMHNAAAPDLSVFACQHHFPERFWQPAAQAHRNSALRITAVMVVAENPADQHIFFGEAIDQRAMHASSIGVTLDTGEGQVEILTPEAFETISGETADFGAGPAAFVGFRIGVGHLAAATACLKAAGVPHIRRGERLVVAAADHFGTVLVFEEAGFAPTA